MLKPEVGKMAAIRAREEGKAAALKAKEIMGEAFAAKLKHGAGEEQMDVDAEDAEAEACAKAEA